MGNDAESNAVNRHSGPIAFKTDGKLRVIDCEACSFAHLDPLPDQEALDRLYRDEYYQSHHTGWFEKERREQWYWGRVYRQRARFARSLLVEQPKFGLVTLDYGAGCGWFVKALGKKSIVNGFEPNEKARHYGAKNLGIGLSLWSADAFGMHWAFHNFIHCALVLEHVLDPLVVLRDIHNLLVTGGVACIVVPNERNPLQRKLIDRYDYSPVHPHHLNYFDAASLTRLAERAGFEIVRATSTFPIESFALHGFNYVKHPKVGILAHWIRMAVEATALTIAPDAWERLKDGWAAKGIGRETELWIRKGVQNERVQVGGWGFPADIAKKILEEEDESMA